jgi:hypothetical protein
LSLLSAGKIQGFLFVVAGAETFSRATTAELVEPIDERCRSRIEEG